MSDSKAIFVEGIMGSGKSTIAQFIAEELGKRLVNARCVLESELPHPTRVMWDLPHPHKPWLDTDIPSFLEMTLKKWEAFVSEARQSDLVTVFDGQFLHGDVTSLLMMDADKKTIVDHVHRFAQMGAGINPALIYFYQSDLLGSMEELLRARGERWENYQIEWKVESPFCRNRGLEGRDGLLELYREYRSISDELVGALEIEKLSIESTDQNWTDYRARIIRFLGVN